jgi:hypothetical protein
LDDLNDHFPELSPVFDIECGVRNTWQDARDTWAKMKNFDSILFFLGHSDGAAINISGEQKTSYMLSTMFNKAGSASTSIIVANACMSLAGNSRGGSSILSLATQDGFSGFIGTEAEILNTKALLCGALLIHGLCVQGLSFGDAFDRMHTDSRLFPLNLFYSCYGDRNFRLDQPLLGSAPKSS